jgi:hypothetical protein
MASATADKPKKLNDKSAAVDRYIAEIDRFATLLRAQQVEIKKLALDEGEAKAQYEEARNAVREAKELEHNTVSMLLKFITPGSIEIMPLFDTMEPTDEKVHGANSTEWRKESILSLGLSSVATRALIDADIVLVGQLQDRVMKGPNWADGLEDINDGMAQAIEKKLSEFIEERKGS